MSTRCVGTIWLAAVIVCCAVAAHGATFHVAPDGADDASGMLEAPWQSLAQAVEAAGPGDTVLIHAGTYAGFGTVRSGRPTGPIVLARHESDEVVVGPIVVDESYIVLDGLTVDADGAAWGIKIQRDPPDFLLGNVVRNCRVKNADVEGIRIRYDVREALIENNEISICGGHGIKVLDGGRDVTLRGNEIHHINRSRTGGPNEDGIQLENFGYGIIVEGNIIHDIPGEDGIDIKRGAPVLVRRNRISRVAQAGILAHGDGIVRLEANLLEECAISVIRGKAGSVVANNLILGGGGVIAYSTRSVRIVHNTLAGGATIKIGTGAERAQDIAVFNNIVAALEGSLPPWLLDVAEGSTYEADCNLYYRAAPGAYVRLRGTGTYSEFADYQRASGQDAHSLVADPLFVNPAEGDYRLRAGSPCIGAGSPDYAPRADHTGARRLPGRVDIGAFVWAGG